MFSLEDDIGGVFVRKNHISFEFTRGFLMNDPKHILEGKCKYGRYLKIKAVDDIKIKNVEFL